MKKNLHLLPKKIKTLRLLIYHDDLVLALLKNFPNVEKLEIHTFKDDSFNRNLQEGLKNGDIKFPRLKHLVLNEFGKKSNHCLETCFRLAALPTVKFLKLEINYDDFHSDAELEYLESIEELSIETLYIKGNI